MKYVYIAIFIAVGLCVVGAYYKGDQGGYTRCRSEVLQAKDESDKKNENIQNSIEKEVLVTSTADIRSWLRQNCTVSM